MYELSLVWCFSPGLCYFVPFIFLPVGISSNIPLHQGRVYIEERHSVTLTCSKTESYGSNYTVDYIHFHKNNEYADGHPYHRVISNTSVQLHIPHVTEKEWRGIIYCAVPDMSESCHYFTSSLTLWIDVVSKYICPLSKLVM